MATPRQKMYECFEAAFGIARHSLLKTTKESERKVQQKRIHHWNIRAMSHISPTLEGASKVRMESTIANLNAQI